MCRRHLRGRRREDVVLSVKFGAQRTPAGMPRPAFDQVLAEDLTRLSMLARAEAVAETLLVSSSKSALASPN